MSPFLVSSPDPKDALLPKPPHASCMKEERSARANFTMKDNFDNAKRRRVVASGRKTRLSGQAEVSWSRNALIQAVVSLTGIINPVGGWKNHVAQRSFRSKPLLYETSYASCHAQLNVPISTMPMEQSPAPQGATGEQREGQGDQDRGAPVLPTPPPAPDRAGRGGRTCMGVHPHRRHHSPP